MESNFSLMMGLPKMSSSPSCSTVFESTFSLKMQVVSSCLRLRAFLREYFPDWADLPKTCESWLLSPVLKELLPEGSRILKFQNAFEIQEVYPENDDALEWVFYVAEGQREGLDLSRLPENTSLQRKMKALMMNGRKPGAAKGTLINSEFRIQNS